MINFGNRFSGFRQGGTLLPQEQGDVWAPNQARKLLSVRSVGAAPPAFRPTAAHGSNRPGARLDGNLGLFRPSEGRARRAIHPAHLARSRGSPGRYGAVGGGYLWVGTTGGLVRFAGSHFRLYNHATTPALVDNSVFCVLAARDGSLWIGTDGGGLVHFKDGVFRAYSEATGLANSFVRSLMEDDQGRIWIGTDNGLFQRIQDKLRQVSTAPYALTRFPAMI
jgi:hypothetical protein